LARSLDHAPCLIQREPARRRARCGFPQHVFANEGDLEKSTKNDAPVGSGPFKFKEYRAGQYYALTRFDDYWNGKAKLDSVTYRFAKDSNSANLALQLNSFHFQGVLLQYRHPRVALFFYAPS
jgi:ABC-type transport system substrate-binding protein